MTRLTQRDPVVVLGGTGRLARALHRSWQDRVDVIWQARGAGCDLVWSPGQEWPCSARARAVVALWGVVPGRGALSDNTELALAAQRLGASLGAERVLHCSSAAVYGPAPDPHPETAANAGASDYGRAKLAMEAALSDWVAAHPEGPASCAMRIANVAGADSAFASIARGGPVTMDRFSDGAGPRRSYVSHAMLARAIAALLACPRTALPSVVNVADSGVIDMADLVRAAGLDLRWTDTGRSDSTVALDLSRLSQLTEPLQATPARLLADGAFLTETAT